LQEVPVALFGLIKMMVGAADQISVAVLKQLLAISDGAAQLKHRTILNANTQTNRGLRQRSTLDSAARIARLLVLSNTAVNGSEIVRSRKELACQTTSRGTFTSDDRR
jgi:hypothetical protein